MATNELLIKNMCTDDFNKFLFRFKIHNLAEFLSNGAQNLMDAVEQKDWLLSENHELLFQLMRDEKAQGGGTGMNNYERIKNMNIDEMAECSIPFFTCPYDTPYVGCDMGKKFDDDCIKCTKAWLESEVQE